MSLSVTTDISQMTFKDVDERVFISTDVDERTESLKQSENMLTHDSSIFSAAKLNELGNLISQSKSVDQILLNSKNSLHDLENQLKISKQNDKDSGSQEASKNTEVILSFCLDFIKNVFFKCVIILFVIVKQLLEMIGKILDLTQQKVDNQKALQISDFTQQQQQCMPLMHLTPAPSNFRMSCFRPFCGKNEQIEFVSVFAKGGHFQL